MDLKKLKIFCEVYRRRGYSPAAKALGLTQSAISQQIKALERDLAVDLFDPEDRSLPTAAADYLIDEAALVLAHVADIRNGIKEATGIGGGTVRFGMIDVAAIEIMPRVLKRFKSAYPKIELEAVVKATGELLDMVEGYELDFAVTVVNNVPDTLSCTYIYDDSIVAVVPKKSGLNRKVLSISDLRGEPLILYPVTSHSRKIVDDAFRGQGGVPAVSMEMHYPAAICSLVQQGMGVGLISELSARENRMRGQAIVPIKELKGARKIGVVRHLRRKLSPQAKALILMVNGSGV